MDKKLELIEADSHDLFKIIDILDQYGCCIINDYLDVKRLNALLFEFDDMFLNANENIGCVKGSHPTNNKGEYVVCETRKLHSTYKSIKDIFLSNFMKEIADKYFECDHILNDEVFLTHEYPSDTEILPWHFDRRHALKFYINLVDVDETRGAFAYDLGSHREGHFRANYYMLSGVKVGAIPNDIPKSELHHPTTISAKAGSLVIFDTDGFHKAGLLTKDERKIIRGHSHAKPLVMYNAKKFASHWWLQSPFNIVKYLKNGAIRNLPNKRLTGAETRK